MEWFYKIIKDNEISDINFTDNKDILLRLIKMQLLSLSFIVRISNF